MNKSSSKRVISKQEATVLLGDLDMFLCSETIESVSISNSKSVRCNEETSVDKSFISSYENRPVCYKECSLYEYFHIIKNSKTLKKDVIPHFVGISGTPRYPVTETYARHVLTVYKPWLIYPKSCNWINDFDNFIKSSRCPASAKMHYERAVCRHINNTTHYEPKSSSVDHSKNPISDADTDLMALVGLKGNVIDDEDSRTIKQLNRGLDYEWDKPPKVISIFTILLLTGREYDSLTFAPIVSKGTEFGGIQ